MKDYKIIETTEEIYRSIYDKHKLCVYSGFTDTEGFYGKPRMETDWMFENTDYPIIKSIQTKKSKTQENWDIKYYLCVAKKPHDND